jgi:hypothetical protein
MAFVYLAADAIMAALSVQSASGAAVASGSEARSSEFAATAADDGDLGRRLSARLPCRRRAATIARW